MITKTCYNYTVYSRVCVYARTHACMCAPDTTVDPALVCAMFQDFGEMMRQNWLAPVADVSGFEELPIQRGTVYSLYN